MTGKKERTRRAGEKRPATIEASKGQSLADLKKELWQAAVKLRGSIEPGDYKRYVLPIMFLRFLSLRYERRRVELERLVADCALREQPHHPVDAHLSVRG